MTVEMFTPRWYYKGKVPFENQQEIERTFEEFMDLEKNFINPDNINGELLTSYGLPTNQSAPWERWLEFIKPCLSEMVDQLKPKRDIEVVLQEAWVNRYQKGHYQEYHCHSVQHCNLAAVYFYRLEGGCTNFKFYNNQHAAYKACGLDDMFEIPTAATITPKVQQGDIIIFPAHYPHLVSPNKSEFERITFSANFDVVPASNVSTTKHGKDLDLI